MPWSWSCLIRVEVYGPWWLLVTEAQEISLESSLTRRVRTEMSLSSFSSDFPCLNLIFLCYCPPPKRVVSSTPGTAYPEVSFCLTSHSPCVYGSISHLFAVTRAYFVLSGNICYLYASYLQLHLSLFSTLVITLLTYCLAMPSQNTCMPILAALS